MSKADLIFIEMCKDILENGFLMKEPMSDPGGRTMSQPTLKEIRIVNRYDLQVNFPY